VMVDLCRSVTAMTGPHLPGDYAPRQAESAVKIFQEASANIEYAGEIFQQANIDAMEVVNRRLAAAVEETRTIFRNPIQTVTNRQRSGS
jgi:hypothetical protein